MSQSCEKHYQQEQNKQVIKLWAKKYGSTKLQKQLQQNYSGWPAYLHERLAFDFADFAFKPCLSQDVMEMKRYGDPDEPWLDVADKLAERVVELKLAETKEQAFEMISIRGGQKCECYDDPSTGDSYESCFFITYVCFVGYSPGFSSDSKLYAISFQVDREDI